MDRVSALFAGRTPLRTAVPKTSATAPTFFASAEAFRRWLDRHAATARELLVGYYKVGSGTPGMSWSQSVDEALCVGWIDGVRKRIDDRSYSIRFTPRKPTSIWSAVNIEKYATLLAQGRMTEAGTAAFALRSESKSRIYAFEQPDVPELATAETRRFMADATAWAYFNTAPPGYWKVVLHWITTARRAETRSRRLARLIEACADGRRLR